MTRKVPIPVTALDAAAIQTSRHWVCGAVAEDVKDML